MLWREPRRTGAKRFGRTVRTTREGPTELQGGARSWKWDCERQVLDVETWRDRGRRAEQLAHEGVVQIYRGGPDGNEEHLADTLPM
eukprot:6688387-Heterocapsa_arctica.AAC.1